MHDRNSVVSRNPGMGVTPPRSSAGALRARCWGTRGSLPSPGPNTVRYGGNTSCLEVRSAQDDRCLVFDAGSGIRGLGERIVGAGVPRPIELFLTHFHWDHIQGLPFFGPLYDARTRLTIHASPQDGRHVQELIAAQMRPVYFPVPFEMLAAHVAFHELQPEPCEIGDVEVTAFRARHPMSTYGYRVRSGGVSLAYFPDDELRGGEYPVSARWYEELCEFLAGVDLLLHDAMYTDAEYARYAGWGHSTYGQAVELALDAGVKRLHLFHHAPERTDTQLDRIADELRDDLARRGAELELSVAAEGEELLVEERIP